MYLVGYARALGLHPLLVSVVRDESTTKSSLDAGPFPQCRDVFDGLLWSDWALEVRRIGRDLAHESHQACLLLRGDYNNVNAISKSC